MNEAKLKPCPFCGTIPHFKLKSNCLTDTSKGVDFTVYCQGCGIEFPQKFSFKIEFDLENPTGIKYVADEREKAAEAWNRRTVIRNDL